MEKLNSNALILYLTVQTDTKMNLPSWALRPANISEREKAADAHYRGKAKIVFKDRKKLKPWMEYHGWKTSWFNLEDAFYKELFSSDEYFQEALSEGVVEVFVPIVSYKFSENELAKIDESYKAQKWNWVVEDMREIRRAVEAGIIIEVDDKKLTSFSSFYEWAHQRYHLLEECADKWIGNDK